MTDLSSFGARGSHRRNRLIHHRIIPKKDIFNSVALSLSLRQWTSRAGEANASRSIRKADRWRNPLNGSGPSRRIPCIMRSPGRENLIEHVFLGELLRGFGARTCGIWRCMRPEVDSGGYDSGAGIQRFDPSRTAQVSLQGGREPGDRKRQTA